MNYILETKDLTKKYGGLVALDKLNLSIEKGAVFGLLGPNGSGKTTSLGTLLGIIHQTEGSYRWFGEEAKASHRKKIGAILEHPNFLPYMTAVQNLKTVADIKGVAYKEIPIILERVGLASRGNSKFRTFSLGMKQRLSIGAALLGNPAVLILDEPTNGLDPQGIAEIRNLILQIAGEGTTVMLASHLLDEVQKVCSHVAVLKAGKTLYTGTVAGVLSAKSAIAVAADDMVALEKALKAIPGTANMVLEGKTWLVDHPDFTDAAKLNSLLHQQGISVSHLSLRTSNLEKDFLALLEANK